MFRLTRHFLKYVRGVRTQIGAGLVFMLLSSLLAGANIGLIYPFFKGVFGDNPAEALGTRTDIWHGVWQLAGQALHTLRILVLDAGQLAAQQTLLKTELADFFTRYAPHTVLLMLCQLALVLITVKILTQYLYRMCFVHVEQTLIRELRDDLFRHLQTLSLDFYQRYKLGELISRVINDVMVVRSLTITKVVDLLSNLLQSLVYLSLALLIDWRMTLISIFVLAPAVGALQYIGQRLRKYSRRAQEHISRVSERLSENLQGIRVVHVFHAHDREQARFSEATHSYFRRVRKLEYVSALSTPFGEWASMLVAVFMLWYGGSRVLAGAGNLSGPAFLTFLGALLSMLHPLKVVARSWNDLQRGTGAGDRLLELFDEQPTVVEALNAAPVTGFHEEIRLHKVSCRFGDKQVLMNIDLCLRKGEMLALVGGSGSGKTTLANLVLRLLDPAEGCITLDGRDLRELRMHDLRRLFGVVGQDTWLFAMSVAQNVGYPELDPDPEAVRQALELANATAFVKEMGGPETLLSEGGTNLSGGQRQRLAIARAVYRHPEILVFDEATSALDTESEKLVQSALDRSIGSRTALVIAHRLSTVIRADRIVCLKDGHIDGIGPHEELLKISPEYRKLYELQFQV